MRPVLTGRIMSRNAQVLFADGTGRKMAADGSEQEVHVAQLCPAVRAPPPSDVPAIAL